ncbi:MAG: asparagine synthase (glutamine-hydrolyzing) [Nitrospirae bacterium]|nr:asparagine synthase (glutamine-hydrolyzing) [Nitrospirota bacterium]
MCGIVSLFAYHQSAQPIDRDELLRIRDRMITRGPDGAGEWYSENKRVAMGHRRLAIIDLSEHGAQPMRNQDNSVVIVFNGEIYNYRELRKGLENKGHQFRSTSDTEVLLHLYKDKGRDMVHELRGMYVFALWDARKKGMFLARDPFGIKPLYYADNGKTFRAASQVKALLAGGQVDTATEPAGHVGFFLWGHVPEPYTLYRGIRALPAGTSLWVDANGAGESATFCSISDELAKASINPPAMTREEMQIQLRESLLDSVRHHLIADVPVGVFLSSGLDSTTLTALAAEAGGNLNTVTLGFEEFRGTEHDEVPLAELIAKQYGARHQTIWVKKSDFIAERERLLDVMDQPSTDGVNTYFVSLAAAKAGMKVAISGLGGDELFGSYPSFSQLPRMVNAFKPFNKVPVLGKALRSLSSPILKTITSPKYAGLVEYGGSWAGAYMLRRGMFMPWEMERLLDKDMVREGLQELQSLERLEQTVGHIDNDYLKVSGLELNWYMRNQLLRDTDWAGMAHSLEIRVPFLDLEFLRSVAPMLCSENRPDKRALASTPAKPLPASVLERGKTGFTVPVREWLIESNGGRKTERGLRGWAKIIDRAFHAEKKRILVLVPDAFGGRGGIALYNRNLLQALCAYPTMERVLAIPRKVYYSLEKMPDNLDYRVEAANSKLRYLYACLRTAFSSPRFDVIICGHLHLLPIAWLLGILYRCPVVPVIYGLEAWTPTSHRFANYLCRRLKTFISIRRLTARRFIEWTKISNEQYYYLPNCVDESKYGIGPRREDLIERYKTRGKTVVMTAGRLDAGHDLNKGFDEILEVLPELKTRIPNLVYLVMGDGEDRARLEEKAKELGVADITIFTGYVSEAEKADHYRLADVFAMPGSHPEFDRYPYRFVFLEALACGVPVVGCRLEDPWEINDPDSQIIIQVNPYDRGEIIEGILSALSRPKNQVQPGLENYYFGKFETNFHQIVSHIIVGVKC